MKKAMVLVLTLILTLSFTSVTLAAPTEINFWSVFTGEDGVNMDQLVAEFNEANPEIKVTHIKMDATDLYTKLPLAVAASEGVPDLSIVHAERIAQLAKDGFIMPIDAIMADGHFTADQYLSAGWKMGEVDGVRYSLPLDVHSYVCYVNLDLLAKYDLDTPVLEDSILTWDEVKAVSKKATADGVTGIGLGWWRPYILSMYYELGGTLSKDGVTASLNNDTFIKLLDDLAEMYNAGLTSVDGEDPFGDLFVTGAEVFCPDGIWSNNGLKGVSFNYAMTIFPQYDTKNIKFWASSHQFVPPVKETTPENQEAVATFLAYVRDNSLLWAQAGQTVASLKLFDDPQYQNMKQSFLSAYGDSMVVSDFINYGIVVDTMDTLTWESVYGRMTSQEYVTALEQKVNEKIASQQ